MPRSARRLPVLAAALLSAVALPACSASGGDAAPAAASGSAATRTVPTAFGDVAVPSAPQRVVALGETALDSALALGVRPVGALAGRGGTGVPAYLADLAGDVAVVGTVRETDLEELVEVDPDLVLASSSTTRAQYDALSALAPTVVPPAPEFGEWEAETLVHAAALGREDQADAVLGELDGRAEALRAGGGGTATVVRWTPEGALVMSGSLMPGRLLEASGATLTEVSRFSDRPHTDPLGLEALGQVDADRLYLATLDADGATALEQARTQPAFARLRAVQAGRVTVVDGDSWSSAAGPVAADDVLDDIAASRG